MHNTQDPTLPQQNLGLRKYIENYSHILCNNKYEGWNFNSGNYLFTTDTK